MKPSTNIRKFAIAGISLLVSLPILIALFQVYDVTTDSWYHLSQNLLGTYAKNTIFVISGVALCTLILGVPTAWWISTNEFPLRRFLDWLLILPLAIPTFINGITYSGLTDYTGPIRVYLRAIGLEDWSIDILNIPGVIFVMSLVLYPYVYLSSRTVFSLQSSCQLEAARMLGASPIKTFFKIGLPLAWPGIFAGLMLVIMEVLNDYGTVHYFGVSTFTTGVFKSWLSLGDISSAVFLSLFLVAFIFILLFFEYRINRGKKFENKGRPFSRTPIIGAKKWLVAFACSLPFLLGFLIPISQLLYWLSLAWDISNFSRIGSALLGSLQVSVIVAFILVLLAWLFNFLKRGKKPTWPWKLISQLALLGYSMPGAVVGVGVVSLVLFIHPNWLFETTIALMIGYVTRFFAVSQNPIAAGYEKISISLDESTRVMGKSAWTLLSRIHFPIIKPALVAAFIMVMIDVTKELPLTLILRPFNFETLSTQAFQFAKDEMAAQSALPSLIIVFISAVPVYFLHRIFGKR